MSKKIVVKLDLHDNKDKQKAMKAVAAIVGIDAISVDMASQKMTVVGTVDPVEVVSRLRKQSWAAAMDSVGPAKEPEKKDDGAKKDDAKKEEGKKDDAKKDDDGGGEKKPPPLPTTTEQLIAELISQQQKNYNYQHYMPPQYFVRSMEENPNACIIC